MRPMSLLEAGRSSGAVSLRALFDGLPNAPAQHVAFEAYAATVRPDVTQHAVFEAMRIVDSA